MFNRRELYGNNYVKMWHRLFDAFENAQNLPHICEYKHQQKLVNQVCDKCALCSSGPFLGGFFRGVGVNFFQP